MARLKWRTIEYYYTPVLAECPLFRFILAKINHAEWQLVAHRIGTMVCELDELYKSREEGEAGAEEFLSSLYDCDAGNEYTYEELL